MESSVSSMPYLIVDSVSKTYKNEHYEKKVLDGVSFTVNKGSFVTIFGPNGSGKTTLFNVISGLTDSDSNSIKLNYKPVKQSKIRFSLSKFCRYPFPMEDMS